MRTKKPTSPPRGDEMLPEYDFRGGVRGKHASAHAEGTNIVLLEPDVARAFPTAADVNRALRNVLAQREPHPG